MTSEWKVETTDRFDGEFKKLGRTVPQRLLAFLHGVEGLDDPRQRGKRSTANHAGVWRYRVGDYRILAQVIDNTLTVLALRVAHHLEVY